MSNITNSLHNAAKADASLASVAGLGAAAIAGGALAIHRNSASLTPAVKRTTAKTLHAPQAYHGTGLQHPRIQGYLVGGGIGLAAASIGLANNAVNKIPSYRANAVGGRGPDPFVSIQREAKKREQLKAASQPQGEQMNELSNLDWLQSSWLDKRAAEETKKAEEKKEKEEKQKRFDKNQAEDKKDDSKDKKDDKHKEKEEKEEKKASLTRQGVLERYMKSASTHTLATIPAHNGATLAALAIAAPVGYALGTGINLLGTRLAENAGHSMSPNSVAVQHPYMTSLAGQVGGAVTGLGPLVSMPVSYTAMAGSQPMAEEAERGHLVDAPLANYSYDNPHAGPFLSMFVPGMHAPNSAIAAQAIANRAQRERNFTWRHPVASTFLHGLIPGSGTAYAQAAAKIQDMKEKSAAYVYSDAAHRHSESMIRKARYESLRADLAESRAASARREASRAKTSEAVSDLGHAIHQYRVHKSYQQALSQANHALRRSAMLGGAVGLGALGAGALGSHIWHTSSNGKKKNK